MSLLKTIDEYQKFVKINKITDFELAIHPFEQTAVNKYIKPYLSAELYDMLHDYYNASDPTANEELDVLLPYVQAALARFSLFVASPFLDINIGSQGYTTSSSQQFVPASEARVKKHDAAMEALAWQSIEDLLVFLEENKDDYPEWVDSSAYTMHISGLINTAVEFDAIFPINASRLAFMKLRPQMKKVELLQIIPAISGELYAEIVEELRDNDLSADNKALLDYLRISIANFTMSSNCLDAYYKDGVSFLALAKKMLDADPDKYPAYRDSTAVRENNDYSTYENTEDDHLFVFGAGGCAI